MSPKLAVGARDELSIRHQPLRTRTSLFEPATSTG